MKARHHIDEYYGHVVVAHDTTASAFAVLVDGGDVVSLDEHHRGPWTEDEAREVGSALIGWAGRKRLARIKREAKP